MMTDTNTTGLPSGDVAETAYRSLIEFGVVGAVLAIILMAMLGIIWWNLIQARKKDLEHQKAAKDQSEKHRAAMTRVIEDHRVAMTEMAEQCREERMILVADFKARIDNYAQVLREKDATLERIQEKRVEMAETAVAAITKTSAQMDQLIAAMAIDPNDPG